MLLATDFMCEAMARATSVLGLTWRASPAGIDVVRDGVGARISGAFTFAGSQPSMPARWLTAEASATVGEDGVMTLKVNITVPVTDGAFVVQGELAYPDFHEVTAAAVDPASTSEQRAITLDMVLRVFRAARECGAHESRSALEPSRAPQADVLKIFSVFALSRMYRWGLVELDEGSAGLSLLQHYAARELTDHVASIPSEVDRWFRNRLVLRRADDVYLDAVLYDIDLSARRRLSGVMADPPMNDPANQLLLLRQAMAAHPAIWASARVTVGTPELAFAVGLDLGPGQVPQQDLERLLADFPNVVPRTAQPAALLPVEFWLTTSPRL